MSRFPKLFTLALALALALSLALTGCGTPSASTSPAADSVPPAADVPAPADDEPADDASGNIPGGDVDLTEEVALVTWLLGDTPVDNDMVYGAVNEVLKERLNTTLDINYIPWSDEKTKYQLLFAAGESFDQCYTAFWTTPVYQVLAARGAFMELTPEMFEAYAPKAYAQVPEVAWKQNRVNGKVYTFPKSASSYDSEAVVIIRGDLRKKYNLPEINSLETYYQYLYTIAENEPGIVPYQVEQEGGQLSAVAYSQPNNLVNFTSARIEVDITDPEQKISNQLDNPKFLEYLNLVKDFHDKGVLPSDAASKPNSSNSGEAFIAGQSATFLWNVNIINAYNAVIRDNPEWEPEIVDPTPDGAAYPTTYRDGVAISPNSVNWQRCLMVQEEIRNDKNMWDTLNYGIEGVHWEPVGDDRYKILDATSNFPADGSCQWGWKTNFARISDSWPQSYVDIEQSLKDHHTDAFLLSGFAIDATNVKNVEAVLENLNVEYWRPLSLGAFEDPAATLEEWKQKREEAGLAEYMAELEPQVAAYIERMK